MNLLLRHSLWRNYTHQSQQGPPRPLTCSSNKRLSKGKKKKRTEASMSCSHCQIAATPVNRSVTFFFMCFSVLSHSWGSMQSHPAVELNWLPTWSVGNQLILEGKKSTFFFSCLFFLFYFRKHHRINEIIGFLNLIFSKDKQQAVPFGNKKL